MKIVIDNKIPFIRERMEACSSSGGEEKTEVVYADPAVFSRELVKDADALVVRTRTTCDSRLLEESGVKLVVTATIGTDHIDLPWCAANGIEVRNAAGCNAPGVAQYVWSSLLRLGFDISGHRLGLVGYGHVGSIVAEWGRRMGAEVLVCDPPREIEGMTDNDYRPLRDILENCDAVTLHTPLTRDGHFPTFHMIGETELGMMRQGAVLVNSSRGPVVDNEAWAEWLANGKGKAVVDVWEGEPEINRRLLSLSSVATPHIAGYSFEGKQRATRMDLEALEECLGLKIPKEGLCGDYLSPHDLDADSASEITASYDPFSDDRKLRDNPSDFEKLRSDYAYRHEPFIFKN